MSMEKIKNTPKTHTHKDKENIVNIISTLEKIIGNILDRILL